MSENSRGTRPSRRGFLAGLTAVAGATLGGCATSMAGSEPSSPTASGGGPVSILAAGSLRLALSEGLAGAIGVPLRIETHGSATLVRLVAAGKRDPDVVSVADTALFESILRPSWYATFASNALVLAYDADSEGGRKIEAAGREAWYDPLRSGAVSLGRTDPDQDPLGYRTLFALDLAERYYDASGLRGEILDRRQVYPETSLLSRFETGAIDAAFVYRNMAVERGYDYVDLPDEIDLSAPEHVEEWYATVSYTLPDGTEIEGDLVSYASTVRHGRESVFEAFETHVGGSYLEAHGFHRPDDFPRYEGDVPDALAD